MQITINSSPRWTLEANIHINVNAMQINEQVSVVFDNRCKVAKAKCLAKLLYNNTLGYSEPAVHSWQWHKQTINT